MAANLLELTQQFITPEVVSKLSGLTGETESDTKTAVNSLLPVVISGLTLKTASKSDASDIMKMVKYGGYDGNLLKNFTNIINNTPKLDKMINGSSNSLISIFRGNLNGLKKKISEEYGISQTAVDSLLGFTGALVLSMTAKQILENNLNAAALKSYLSEQESFLRGLIQPEISASYGFSTGEPASLAHFDDKADIEESVFKRSMPWISVAACAILLFMLWRSCGTDKLPESSETKSTGFEMQSCETVVSVS